MPLTRRHWARCPAPPLLGQRTPGCAPTSCERVVVRLSIASRLHGVVVPGPWGQGRSCAHTCAQLLAALLPKATLLVRCTAQTWMLLMVRRCTGPRWLACARHDIDAPRRGASPGGGPQPSLTVTMVVASTHLLMAAPSAAPPAEPRRLAEQARASGELPALRQPATRTAAQGPRVLLCSCLSCCCDAAAIAANVCGGRAIGGCRARGQGCGPHRLHHDEASTSG